MSSASRGASPPRVAGGAPAGAARCVQAPEVKASMNVSVHGAAKVCSSACVLTGSWTCARRAGGQEECLFDDINSGTKVSGSFQVSTGGFLDIDAKVLSLPPRADCMRRVFPFMLTASN